MDSKMNQTKKRLHIISLAISITDLETIQLQILKLAPLKNDAKLQEILTLLQAESYAQAQSLITEYIEVAPEDIHQRSAKISSTPEISEEDQKIIDEFQLFVTSPEKDETATPIEIDINQYDSKRPRYETKEKNTDFDALLNLEPEDILSENITIDISDKHKDTFFSSHTQEHTMEDILDDIPKDTFFDTEENTTHADNTSENNSLLDIKEEHHIHKETGEEQLDSKEITDSTTKIPSSYPPIPHIYQKFIHLKKMHPPIQKSYQKFETVENFLMKISQNGYTEEEMEEMYSFIEKLIKKSKFTEAAHLLLVCGATESKFAQFIFARALYTGAVLSKNIDESFRHINTLAMENYPEALCDLGQFYEYGIGTKKDTAQAESLYKKAADLGIKRAIKHYERLRKRNKRIFKKI
jgi:hypothetical protein